MGGAPEDRTQNPRIKSGPLRLLTLVEQRFRDNYGRPRAWGARAASVAAKTSAMSARPATTGVDPAASHAGADYAERQDDAATEALQLVAQALPRLLSEGRLIALAATFR